MKTWKYEQKIWTSFFILSGVILQTSSTEAMNFKRLKDCLTGIADAAKPSTVKSNDSSTGQPQSTMGTAATAYAQHAQAAKNYLDYISADGTDNHKLAAKEKMFPRGSAVLTSSGKLKDQGITAIIHAASGTMGGPREFDPTRQSVANSVTNSIKLAQKFGITSVAIPFIGGAIFLDRIGGTREELADTILEAALKAADGKTELKFVGFDPRSTQTLEEAYKRVQTKLQSTTKAAFLTGDITSFKLHGAAAIVNAANTELQFGAGVSGAIGKASGTAFEIEDEAQLIREAFETRFVSIEKSPTSPALPLLQIDFSQPKQNYVSALGTTDGVEATKKKLFPLGSAVMTTSGKLKETGIVAIIHAASGSSGSFKKEFDPNLDSVGYSVVNSIVLAKNFNAPAVAIPFIGGQIFLMRIGTTPEILADRIMESALTAADGGIELKFLAFSATDGKILSDALARAEAKIKNGTKASVLLGDITKFSVHGAPIIVNAANTELRFGGGVSGAIGSASKDAGNIDQEAQAIRAAYEAATLPK